MCRPDPRIAHCVPLVVRASNCLRPRLREVAPRSRCFRSRDQYRSVARNWCEFILNALGNLLWTIISAQAFLCPFMHLLRGLEGDRCNQVNLLRLKRLIDRADSGGFQDFARLSREPVRDFQPDRIICGGCLVDHASCCLLRPIVKRSGVLIEPSGDHSGLDDWLIASRDLAHDVIDLLAHIEKLTLIPCSELRRSPRFSEYFPRTRFRDSHRKPLPAALRSLPYAPLLRCPHP